MVVFYEIFNAAMLIAVFESWKHTSSGNYTDMQYFVPVCSVMRIEWKKNKIDGNCVTTCEIGLTIY